MTSEQKQDSTPENDFLSQPQVATNREIKRVQIAEKIAVGILRAQSWFSEKINRFRYLKVLLICFCVTSATVSAYVLVDAIVSKPAPNQSIKIDRISSPHSLHEPSEELFDERIPEEVVQSIKAYKKYMDSIGEMIRPGLLDSMRVLEEMYLQQQNK